MPFFVARIYILCYKFFMEKKKYHFDVFDVILIVIALTIVGFVIYNNFINVGYEIKYQGFIEHNQICLYFKNKGQETVIRPTDFALEINNSNIRYVPQKIEYKVDYSILDTITITEDMFIVGENEQKIFYVTFDNELFSNVHNISIFFKGKQIK